MPTSTPNRPWRWSRLRDPARDMRPLRPTAGRTLGGRPGTEGPHAHIYGSERWKQLRRKLVREHPYCARCGARGRRLYCDHKQELRDGGPAFDASNIEVLCHPCHMAKTAEARRARG